ncbi:AfsR/SARP family transcriptional regulator, partial [Streptomyces sp. NPDC013178]|uniref:AfsR/SARP family transcriptional regulator n=1 Tax=Streptomyces sp. NPDC013178 TaxID=3155118 RepID=UPI00340A9FB3
MQRHELRFGLLGPPVLYDTGIGTGADTNIGTNTGTGVFVNADPSRTTYASEAPYPYAADVPDAHDVPQGAALPGAPVPAVPRPPARPIRSPKVRALLAALLLDAGRIVPVESLKEVLWGGAPPASAQASLHNHITRLRRLLDDPRRLRAVPPGYRLRVEHGELDVHVFERHLAAARGAHAARNWERVVRECAAALALWRDTPLTGLPAELGGYAFTRRLNEARLLLLEWRYDAELAVGGARLDRLVPELTALTAEHPLREAYHRQLMLALHHTDRQAEALAVHRDLRTRLIDQLGIEPGPAVREAHMEVLRGATTREEPTPASTDAPIPTLSHSVPGPTSPPPVSGPASGTDAGGAPGSGFGGLSGAPGTSVGSASGFGSGSGGVSGVLSGADSRVAPGSGFGGRSGIPGAPVGSASGFGSGSGGVSGVLSGADSRVAPGSGF